MNTLKYLALSFLLLTASSAATAEGDYFLGAGDVIAISVLQQPDLELQKKVSESGNIRFPFVGVVSLVGKTEFQAEMLLEEKLKRSNYVKSPQVTVRIMEYHSSIASVDGKVANPGEYPVVGTVTVQQLVARAGGLLEGASSEISLFRKGQSVKKINLFEIYDAGQTNAASIVRSGDRVLISAAPVFYTYGALEKPGRYEYRDGMTVYQALSTSGGLTEAGSEKNIEIIRGTESKSVSASLNDKIQPNDVIKIKESRF